MKIGILYICTGKYKIFWKDFYLSCEKYFISEAEKEYFVFTDSESIDFEKENPKIHRIFQENLGWPGNTLRRYGMFLNFKKQLVNFDYLFFFNADLQFLQKITTEEFLPVGQEKLVACLHSGYFNKKISKFPYEKNNSSLAFVDKKNEGKYFQGAINGGNCQNFIEAIEIMNENIKLDQKNNIVAVWHDESHWNRYLSERDDVKILSPSYLYPEASKLPFDKKIMIRDKRKYFNYIQVGKENIRESKMQKIKMFVEKNGFIQRNIFWQIVKRWLSRIKFLRTIYRNDKLKTIKSYFKNDLDYIKIKKEINNFKRGNIYDFGGVKIPLSVITADTFFNVLKPNIENIKYEAEEIGDFYKKQKEKYKTLIYWKDFYLNREPDYIGGHIISHGFPYFFKEIIINKDDIVIDLGAAPGDFSAVCIQKEASKVYAFEPEENNSSNLDKIGELNENKIDIVRKYCGEKTDESNNLISLDDFVDKYKLNKVDFIKADIEGAEAKVLIGAKNVLKRYQPKLVFCTYHSVDDEKEIEKAIISANSNYKIYKKRGVIYAF